jgi:hypothetical protein
MELKQQLATNKSGQILTSVQLKKKKHNTLRPTATKDAKLKKIKCEE